MSNKNSPGRLQVLLSRKLGLEGMIKERLKNNRNRRKANQEEVKVTDLGKTLRKVKKEIELEMKKMKTTEERTSPNNEANS